MILQKLKNKLFIQITNQMHCIFNKTLINYGVGI